jgi:hypothetical protein
MSFGSRTSHNRYIHIYGRVKGGPIRRSGSLTAFLTARAGRRIFSLWNVKNKDPAASFASPITFEKRENSYFCCSASCTLPTIFADGVRVLSPSSFHFEGQASSAFLER